MNRQKIALALVVITAVIASAYSSSAAPAVPPKLVVGPNPPSPVTHTTLRPVPRVAAHAPIAAGNPKPMDPR